MTRVFAGGFLSVVCTLAMVAAAPPATAPSSTAPTTRPGFVTVGGRVENPGNWTVARLRDELKSDLKTISYEVKGVKHQSECVSLDALLRVSQVKLDTKRKSHILALVVSVVAHDGYAASFSLGELSSDVGNHPAFLALDVDGSPLSDREGPLKLVVPDDKKASRGVFRIATITVSDPTATP